MILSYWPFVVFAVLVLLFLASSVFTIHTKQAGVVEAWGKFSRIAHPGLNFKTPLFERLVYVEDLNMQLLDVEVTSKTKNGATIKIPVRVQYFVMENKVKEAYYELDEPESQIQAHVENVILSYIPTVDLDDAYQQEELIASRIKSKLSDVMAKFGYSIENALVTQIIPDDRVVAAMNDIIAARSRKVSAEAAAEANKITVIAAAEAEAEAKRLAGEGIAKERHAIMAGLQNSMKEFTEAIADIDPIEVAQLLIITQHYDTLKHIGNEGTTVLLPYSPSSVLDLQNQIRTAIISANAVKGKEA